MGTRMVMVASKLPSGIRCDILPPNFMEAAPDPKDPRDSWKPVIPVASFTLKGSSLPRNEELPEDAPRIAGGYALTEVPEDLWAAWLAQNKDSHLVRNHFIFANVKEASTVAQAKEQRDIRTGMEPLTEKQMPKDVKLATAEAA